MKKLLIIICLLSFTIVKAQLPNGSVAPDFTATDINGNTWNLYTLLDQGKTVYIDFSATWCGACWNYHQSGAFENLWENYGPDGSDEVFVFFIESDAGTDLADLLGTGNSTYGNWTSGVDYPIIDNASIANAYQLSYYPTIFMICPDRILTEMFQSPAANLYAQSSNCPNIENGLNLLIQSYDGTTVVCGSQDLTPRLTMQNMGTELVTEFSITTFVGGVSVSNYDWSGILVSGSTIEINLPSISTEQFPGELTFLLSCEGDVNSNDNSLTIDIAQTTSIQAPIEISLLTDNYPTETQWLLTNSSGDVIATETYSVQYQTYTYTYELAPGCYTYQITDSYGDGLGGAQWGGADGTVSITDANGVVVYTVSGDFGSQSTFYFEVLPIEGCTDANAANYNSTAMIDDGTCVYLGCTDPEADNYDPIANMDNMSCEYTLIPDQFNFLITGSNHTILVPENIQVELLEFQFEPNDLIGVFFEDDFGQLQCAGSIIWNGQTNSIAAQGDDATTDEKDGFDLGEAFVWMIWDSSEDLVHQMLATYNSVFPNQQSYVINGISGLINLIVPPLINEQEIYLPEGWSMISTYILSENMDLISIFEPVVEDLMLVKNNAGMAYLTAWNYNGVGDMLIGQGYQLKMESENSLLIEGAYQAPEDNPISLTQGWNMIGYLRTSASDCEAILSDIVADVILLKDFEGNAYLPSWNYNGVGDLEPGRGYQMKMHNDNILNYLPNDLEYRMSEVSIISNKTNYYIQPKITSNNMLVGIATSLLDKCIPGDEIAAYDVQGVIVGAAMYNSPISVITLWGDDATTETKDGLFIGEAFSFEIWHAETNRVEPFEIMEWELGADIYEVDGISLAGSVEMIASNQNKSIQLLDAVPNPASNSNTIQFYLPEPNSVCLSILNILGEVVEVISGDFETGYHSISLNLISYNAGAYFYQLETANFLETKRLQIIK